MCITINSKGFYKESENTCGTCNPYAVLKVADHDIVCYKTLIYVDRNTFINHYETPYEKKRVSRLKVYGFMKYKANGNMKDLIKQMKKSYFHSKGESISLGKNLIHTSQKKYQCVPKSIGGILFECIIPKGTIYVEDIYHCDYASREIRFIKEIKD